MSRLSGPKEKKKALLQFRRAPNESTTRILGVVRGRASSAGVRLFASTEQAYGRTIKALSPPTVFGAFGTVAHVTYRRKTLLTKGRIMPTSCRNLRREQFLGLTGAGLGLAAMTAVSPARAAAGGPPPSAADSPQEALALLRAGNKRFYQGTGHTESLTARRIELTEGQAPFAAILGCSDSRVPGDTVFDVVPGHIFSVRIAGNYLTDGGLGSLEYAVAVLKTPLIVVLGHSACGAVDATIKYVRDGTSVPGQIMSIVHAIEPAAKESREEPGDWLHNATSRNVRNNMTAIEQRSEIIANAVRDKQVAIAGGVYDLHSGKVTFF
jgi:carbonic anhydrase